MTEEENSAFQALTADLEAEYQEKVTEWSGKLGSFLESMRSMPKPRKGETMNEWFDRIIRWSLGLDDEGDEGGVA